MLICWFPPLYTSNICFVNPLNTISCVNSYISHQLYNILLQLPNIYRYSKELFKSPLTLTLTLGLYCHRTQDTTQIIMCLWESEKVNHLWSCDLDFIGGINYLCVISKINYSFECQTFLSMLYNHAIQVPYLIITKPFYAYCN